MKKFFPLLGLAALSFAAMPLTADPIDPVYSMGDPSSGTPIGANTFTFGADALGGGVFAFVNQSGNLWTKLDVFVQLPTGSVINCGPAPFFNFCQVSSVIQTASLSLFDIDLNSPSAQTGGIPDGEFFTINLNDLVNGGINTDPNGAGGWGPGNDFSATANLTNSPEPATAFFVLAGLGMVSFGVLGRRRRVRP